LGPSITRKTDIRTKSGVSAQAQAGVLVRASKTDPFWAITKHADIIQIAKQPQLFLNGPRLLIFVNESGTEESPTPPFRHLLDMDPPITATIGDSQPALHAARGASAAARN